VVEARVSEFEPNRRVVLEYPSDAGPLAKGAAEIITMEPIADAKGTRLTHRSEGNFSGLWKVIGLLGPIAYRRFTKEREEELARIKRGVENQS
jgi:hypothetical protein